jgi:hypothetical protein
MVTFTTIIMFLIFNYMQFWVGEFYEGGSRVRRPRMKWSTIVESLRNTVLVVRMKYIFVFRWVSMDRDALYIYGGG